jgi:hypothetical protein
MDGNQDKWGAAVELKPRGDFGAALQKLYRELERAEEMVGHSLLTCLPPQSGVVSELDAE